MRSNRISRIAFVLIVAIALAAAGRASTRASSAPRAADALRVSAATRAVVISPHPDDGVLGSAGLIERIVSRGGSVVVVELTSGDAFPKGVAAVRHASQLTAGTYRWYGSLREREVLNAMHDLGVSRSRVRFLGFPDEGLCELADLRSASTVFVSPYTHRDRPPAPERIDGGVKYRGDDARAELEELFAAFRPTVIVLPDGRDEHPDHCATHMLAHEAAAMAVSRGLNQPRFLHYLIHYRGWPIDRTVAPNDSTRAVLTLTAAERTAKLRAIDAYRSQVRVMPAFMHAFAAADERFVVGDAEPSPACWCRGDNIAAPKPSAGTTKRPD